MYDGDEVNEHDANEDGGVLEALRTRLSRLHVRPAPPVDAVVRRGRARRRQQRSVLAGAGTAAAVALAIGVPALGHSTGTRVGSGSVHVNLAGFSVDSNPGGTVSLSVNPAKSLDPTELSSVLARAGVRAVVRVGSFCSSRALPAGFKRIVQVGAPVRTVQIKEVQQAAKARASAQARTALVIKPSAMPRESELSIGDFSGKVAVGLVTVNAPLSCAAQAGGTISFAPTDAAACRAELHLTPLPLGSLPVSPGTLVPLPASTLPASTLPASTLPGSATTSLAPGGTAAAPTAVFCVVGVAVASPGPSSSATTTSAPAAASATTTLPSASST